MGRFCASPTYRAASGVPSVGAVLAPRLLDPFGSLRAARAATPEALATVPGAGSAMAERLVALLR